MQEEKSFTINFAEGQTTAEVILRHGDAPKVLDPKAPLTKHLSGTIKAPLEYLTKRLNTGQFKQENCHIIVNREKISIKLVINESDAYLNDSIEGKLMYDPRFTAFGILGDKKWRPQDLGLFCKMNRAFFQDREQNMKLVKDLMSFTATINAKMERQIHESGSKTDNFTQEVNSNLPQSFMLRVPIFKGMPAEDFEVETLASVDGRDVSFVLISPGAQETLETIRDSVIDEQLKGIIDIAPEIVIIEV